jgi:hypothetical protein
VGNRRTKWWARLLDGQRVCGSIDVWPGRYGFQKYRLVLFPPGITTPERRLLRLWRGWPMWGAAMWLVMEIRLAHSFSPGAATLISTSTYLAAGAATFALAGTARSHVRSLSVVVIEGHDDPRSSAIYAELNALVDMLIRADQMRDRGAASTVHHEAGWWQAYDRVGAATERLPNAR